MRQQSRRRVPILIIDVVKVDYSTATIKLVYPDHSTEPFETSWGHGTQAEYYERYREALIGFKEPQGDSLDQDFATLTRAFQALFEHGKVLFDELFAHKAQEVRDYLSKHMMVTAHCKHVRPTTPGVIQVRTENIVDVIPLECLVISSPKKPEIRGWPDVLKIASRVLGFSFIINRVATKIERSKSRKLCLSNVPRLPMKYFWCESLGGAKAEYEFFKKYEKYLLVDGPWPHEYDESTAEKLVQYLLRPDLGFGQLEGADTCDRPRDEIHHLSCHVHTDEENSWKCSLELTGSQEITLKAMEFCLPDPPPAGQTTSEMPLVFFNGCGTSYWTPQGMTSFPRYFLSKNKNCGFIGCEVGIPDLFASKFCEQFYLHLLRGFGVGEALFWARRKLLVRYGNALGVLYTAYVDPYLRVTQAEDSI